VSRIPDSAGGDSTLESVVGCLTFADSRKLRVPRGVSLDFHNGKIEWLNTIISAASQKPHKHGIHIAVT
jgi:hypothetical protein